jgi:hypothetical protein
VRSRALFAHVCPAIDGDGEVMADECVTIMNEYAILCDAYAMWVRSSSRVRETCARVGDECAALGVRGEDIPAQPRDRRGPVACDRSPPDLTRFAYGDRATASEKRP